jgi:hypothetical protein
VKDIHKFNVQGVPIQIEDWLSPTKEESKERNDSLVVAERATLWKIVQLTSPRPRTRRRHVKPKPSQQSRLGMTRQVKMKPNTRGTAASTHHQAPHMCLMARGNIESSSSSESDKDDD